MTENTALQNGHADYDPGATTAMPAPEVATEDTDAEATPNTQQAAPSAEATDDTTEAEESPQRVDAEVDKWIAQRGDWLADLAERHRTRRAVIPPWMRDATETRQTLTWIASYYAHVWAYQATRTPLYLLRLTGRAPRGASRAVNGYLAWVLDWESEGPRNAAAQRNDPEDYIKLARQRDRRVRARATLSLLAAVVVVVVLAFLLALPSWCAWVALAVLVAILGWVGSPADRPLIDRAVLPTQVEPLTSDVVQRALGALGIAEITKALSAKGEGIRFPAPITRDGPGWRAEADLPYGVTAADVMERRDKLASGLRRPLGCVWPEPVSEEHPGRLVLWVGDKDMAKAPQPAWPLSKTGTADLFEPVPFGHDQRGRLTSVPLVFESVLIGAKPRMGKTFALRVLLLAAALDPLCELRIFELKGTGDCEAPGRCAHHYASGADDETLAACLESLRELAALLDSRARTIRGLPRDICPENKVTPELAKKAALGLHLILFAIDECQELFTHPDFGEEAARLAEAVIKRGPALGIIPVFATQRPDAKSLPPGVSANIGIRFCLRVMGQMENDMVLGTSSYKNGVRATTFTNKDKGIGYLVGAHDDPVIVRGAYIDGPAAEAIATRAYAIRKAAGRLSGHAAGEVQPQAPVATLLADMVSVRRKGEGKAWSSDVVDRLAELRPEVYGNWAKGDDAAKARQLSSALRPFGIEPTPIGRRVGGKAVTRYGITWKEITERNENRGRSQG